MVIERHVLILAHLIASLITFALAIVTWRKRQTAGMPAVFLSICMFAVTIYDFGYAMELASSTLPTIMFWVRFEHWGIQVVAPVWVLFTLAITGREKYITRRNVSVLFFFPAVFLLISQTLGTLNLGHLDPRLDTNGPFPTFTYDRGLFIYSALVFTCLCLMISTYFFTVMLIHSAPAFRIQAIFFWLGSLVPWMAALAYNLGWMPHNLDPIPITLSLSALLYLLGFYKFRMLELVPLGRDMIIESLEDGILLLDGSAHIIDINPRAQAMLPTVNDVSVGQQAAEALVEYPALLALITTSSLEVAEFTVNVRGETYHYRAVLKPLLNRRNRIVGRVMTIYDNTRVKRLVEQLQELATHDSLTGVYNVRTFYELAEQELYRVRRYNQALSLIMFDLDRFKQVNDTYGHAAGDAVLKAVTGICSGILRKSDIIGRYGGEEFIILLPETDSSVAVILAQRLRAALEDAQIAFEGHIIQVQASFGVAGVHDPGNISLDELLRNVDHSMYQAKEAGRNQVCVSTLG